MTFSHNEVRDVQGNEPEWTQRDQEVVQLRQGGLSAREVGVRLGLGIGQVYRILHHAGIERAIGADPSKVKRNRNIVRVYVEHGATPEEIGAQFHLQPGYVRDILRSAGVSLARPGRRPHDLCQRNQEIARLYVEGGLSLEEVAARFGLRPGTVSKALRRCGVPLRRSSTGPPQHLSERNQEIIRLYAEEGPNLRQLGARFGISHERVRQILKRAGVARRPQGGVTGPRRSEGSVRGPLVRLQKRNQEIVCLYVEGCLSLHQVGSRFGLTHTQVRNVLMAAGVSRRGVGRRASGSEHAHDPRAI